MQSAGIQRVRATGTETFDILSRPPRPDAAQGETTRGVCPEDPTELQNDALNEAAKCGG